MDLTFRDKDQCIPVRFKDFKNTLDTYLGSDTYSRGRFAGLPPNTVFLAQRHDSSTVSLKKDGKDYLRGWPNHLFTVAHLHDPKRTFKDLL